MSKTPERVCFAGAVVTPLEFQYALKAREQAKLKKLKAAPLPLTDKAIRARIEFLKADNARMRRIVELRAQASAEQLMQQMLGNRKVNKN